MTPELRKQVDTLISAVSSCFDYSSSYIDQLSYLIFLKLLDEEEDAKALAFSKGESRKQALYPAQAARFRWSQWKNKSELELYNFIGNEVFPYMESLIKEDAQVAEYFRDATFSKFESGQYEFESDEPNDLKNLIQSIDLIPWTQLNNKEKGEIYELLLSKLFREEDLKSGGFRTPAHIRQCMIHLLDPEQGERLFDPVCGSGDFLADSVEYIQEKDAESQADCSIYGSDISRKMIRLSTLNLLLHGCKNPNLKRGNALSEQGGFRDGEQYRCYDVIFADPAGAVLPKEALRSELCTKSRKTELLFLALIMESLAPGGRCAVIVPELFLFAPTSAHINLRKKLLNEFEVQAVVSLPICQFDSSHSSQSLLPYGGVKTSLLIFRSPLHPRKEEKAATSKIFFYEILNDGYENKVEYGERKVTPEQNDLPNLLKTWGQYKSSNFEHPPGVEHNTVLDYGSENPKYWWAKTEDICENTYTLACSRYKPCIAEKTNEKGPADLLLKLLKIEKEIHKGLEALLLEVR